MSIAPGERLGHYDLLATIGNGGMGDVYKAPDSRARRHGAAVPADEIRGDVPAISPDNRWIAYSSDRTGTPEIYVRPVQVGANPESSEQSTVSAGSGRFPAWDRKRLYYVTLNGALNAVDVMPGAPSFQHDPPRRLSRASRRSPGRSIPSNNRFLFQQPEGTTGPPPPFTVVLNWMARLKQ